MPLSNSQCIGVLGLSGTFSSKIAPSLLGIVTPYNTLFLGPSPLIIPNGISIGSGVLVWVPNAMLYNALSTLGQITPKIAPSPWDFVNMHKNLVNSACGSGDIIADRHTDVLITILRNHSCGQSNEKADNFKLTASNGNHETTM